MQGSDASPRCALEESIETLADNDLILDGFQIEERLLRRCATIEITSIDDLNDTAHG